MLILKRYFGFTLLLFTMCKNASAQINLVAEGKSNYHIVTAALASQSDAKAAMVLQNYIKQISGVSLPIVTDQTPEKQFEICIGKSKRITAQIQFINDGFLIKAVKQRLLLYGNADKSSLYAVYHFLDSYLGCKKYTAGEAFVPKQKSISVKSMDDLQNPQFAFRQVYYPNQYNQEYLDWHKLHLLENEWGLWGHTFDKLVPPATYFKMHPAYYALVNGERKETQLCLSNPEVYKILVNNLRKEIVNQPDKKYWSVSQNDGLGYCTCDKCAAIDKKHGGPQGSVINFVNKVAANFPKQTISTLAYLYSKHPPVGLKPIANVSIMLSSIDMNRAKPIESNPTAGSFRNDVEGWQKISNQVMIWDYVVQFTNYISPFPNLQTIQPNMNYFGKAGLQGGFLQGTEGTIGEFSDLKSYILAKLSWLPQADVKAEMDGFIKYYYGEAAPYICQYIDLLTKEQQKSNRILDIYGDPTAEWKTWLKPELIVQYGGFFDKAEQAVAKNQIALNHVDREILALEFAVLQQARFYGLEKHGVFIANGDKWGVKPGFEKKVERFINAAKALGVKQFNEEGIKIDDYKAEWDRIFKEGPLLHLANGKPTGTLTKFNEDYPAKGNRTLTDGSRGYNNFQYNYLGWYGTDMEAIIDLGDNKSIRTVIVGFLEDQRHWAFLPSKIVVSVSRDEENFTEVGSLTPEKPYENYDKDTHRLKVNLKEGTNARFVKIKAVNIGRLPVWRDFPNRKPWLFCDEIEVR